MYQQFGVIVASCCLVLMIFRLTTSLYSFPFGNILTVLFSYFSQLTVVRFLICLVFAVLVQIFSYQKHKKQTTVLMRLLINVI